MLTMHTAIATGHRASLVAEPELPSAPGLPTSPATLLCLGDLARAAASDPATFDRTMGNLVALLRHRDGPFAPQATRLAAALDRLRDEYLRDTEEPELPLLAVAGE